MPEITGNVTEGVYKGKSIRTFKGEYKSPSNDPDFRGGAISR